MKAAILRDGQMVVEEVPDPTPGPGQVLVEPIACGICGSDLHTVKHVHDIVAAASDIETSGFADDLDPDRDVFMGHELSCRVLAVGEGVEGIAEGQEFAAQPFVNTPAGFRVIGYHNELPAGYCDQLLLSPQALVSIPNGLDPRIAALTEPMAVGLRAVKDSQIEPGRVALVAGAGPVGLAIIAALSTMGIEAIVASDFSLSRRELAQQMGAGRVIDPATHSLIDAWREIGDGTTPPVYFDAVGVPGMIDALMQEAPERSQILVAGMCIPPDTFRPFIGVYKSLNLQFTLGWSQSDFLTSLSNLAEGRIDGSALITGEVDLDGVPQAFADLSQPDTHVKILVRPDL